METTASASEVDIPVCRRNQIDAIEAATVSRFFAHTLIALQMKGEARLLRPVDRLTCSGSVW
jgi:hypothetical protein